MRGRTTPIEVIERIEAAFASGMSIRAVALKFKISKNLAHTIQQGQHAEQQAAFLRCPKCGGMVQMPCQLCRIRADMPQRR